MRYACFRLLPHRLRALSFWLLAFGFWLLVPGFSLLPSHAQPTDKPRTTRILFVLDGSGSMRARWENSVRLQVAKTLLAKLADSLDDYPNLQLGLRVYGHQYPASEKNCQDSRLEVPFAPRNAPAIRRRLDQLVFQGNTPITYALTQAAGDFPPADPTSRNVIIIITDGLESCGGDLCAASLALQKKRVFLRPFIIGLGAEEDYAKQFQCGGQFYKAADISTFRTILRDVISQTLRPTTVQVALTDEAGRPVETNVNMTFINTTTDQPEYNYVHYLSPQGPDVLDVDPLLSYDLVVNTVPPVTLRGLKIKGGQANVFSVKCPQGTLWTRQDGPSPYGQVLAIVRQAGQTATLLVQPFGTRQKLLAGRYDLEILTLPRIVRSGVEVRQGETLTVTYPAPGVLNIANDLTGYGTVYQLDKDGNQAWVTSLPEASSKGNVSLQPGDYRLCFRGKNATGSKYTAVQNFTIRSGATTTLKIFAR